MSMNKNSRVTNSPYGKIRIWKNLDWYLREIKDFIIRGKQGYCSEDTYYFNDYLSEIIVFGVKDLLKTKQGISYNFIQKYCKGNTERALEKYKEYLKEMAQHFYNGAQDNKDKVCPNKYDKFMKMLWNKKNYDVNKKTIISEKWFEEEKRIAKWQEEETKKGLEMFKEFYFDLRA